MLEGKAGRGVIMTSDDMSGTHGDHSNPTDCTRHSLVSGEASLKTYLIQDTLHISTRPDTVPNHPDLLLALSSTLLPSYLLHSQVQVWNCQEPFNGRAQWQANHFNGKPLSAIPHAGRLDELLEGPVDG